MTDDTIMIKSLIKKHMEGSTTHREEAVLIQLWNLYDDDELAQIIEEVSAKIPLLPEPELPKIDAMAMASQIVKMAATRKAQPRKKAFIRYAVSVAACILIVTGIWINRIITEKQQYKIECGPLVAKGDINTAGYNCTIKDGEKIYLADSNASLALRYSSLEVIQQPGRIIYRHATRAEDTASFHSHEISTAPQQQYLVELPGSVILRLNAQTTLTIVRDSSTGALTVNLLKGEIFVGNKTPFTMIAPNAHITSSKSSYDVRVVQGGSFIAVSEGELKAQSVIGEKVQLAANDYSALLKIKKDQLITDSVITERGIDVSPIMVWKNTERVYNNVLMADFVDQMQYWFGIRFENMNCLPKKPITTRICYKASLSNFFALLKHNGVTVRQTQKGNYTFCNPAPKTTNQMAAVICNSH